MYTTIILNNDMLTKNILLIGENLEVIISMCEVILAKNFTIYVISPEKYQIKKVNILYFVCDRQNEILFSNLITMLTNYVGKWYFVFDSGACCGADTAYIYALINSKSDRYIFLLNIASSKFALMHSKTQGNQTQQKIRMESYIRTQTLPWTILRPYHIVGPGSLLGCIPDHNRDPELVARLQRGEALELCNGGDIDFNIVHPADIGRAVLAVAENPATIHKAYNCVNPEPVKARDYYAEIARQVGGTLKIKTKPYQEVWDEQGGWELTTLPHVYDVSDLERDTGFVPRVSYQECIRDALAHPPVVSGDTSTIPVHQRMTAPPRPRRFPWLFN